MPDWIRDYLRLVTPRHVEYAALLSFGLLLVGMAFAALVVTLWPADHFQARRPLWERRHPALRVVGRVLRNALGMIVLIVGVVLAVPGVPGPGLLVMFIGLTLIDFPGKKRLELWLLRRPTVHRALDRVRARFGRPPLKL